MKQQSVIFFIPGGPGFNCAPEEQLLAPSLEQQLDSHFIFSFADPRDLGALGLPSYLKAHREQFEKTLALNLNHAHKAQRTVTIIAHSFGAVAALHLAQHYPQYINQILFIAPAQAAHLVDQRILDLCLKESKKSHPALYQELHQRPKISPFFNQADVETLLLIAKHYPFTQHYFASATHHQQVMNCYQGINTFNLETYLSVRRQYASPSYHQYLLHYAQQQKQITSPYAHIPSYFIVGSKEQHINIQLEFMLLKPHFSTLHSMTFAHSGHYPHLEQQREFILLLKELLSANFRERVPRTQWPKSLHLNWHAQESLEKHLQ
jgi:pimeloyl-ACP methyl ester carboxylesterase